MSYVIAGDTENYKGCLVYACGESYEHAENVLRRMLSNPTENDKIMMQGHINLRVEEVPEEDCWWY